ncbi:MAG: FHA domain-containing protein, partial [Ilumatobacter sp.]
LLIGRDAPTHGDVITGQRQGVLLTDASNVVSRHHLAITLREWDVFVADLGSANGTLFIATETGQAVPLTAHQEVKMGAGDRLQIGPRTLQLELHHVATPQ